jgi:hypothetical protein
VHEKNNRDLPLGSQVADEFFDGGGMNFTFDLIELQYSLSLTPKKE